MTDVMGIVWLFVLLAANAFFVAAEFAVVSARRSQIEPRAESGKRSAQTALWAMEHATLMLATSQLGITVCSLLILNVSEPAIHHFVEIPLGLTGWNEDVLQVLGFIIALVIVSYLHVVLGEMVPKNLSFSLPDRAVLILAPPLVVLVRIFHPVTVVLNAIANGVLRLFRVEPKTETTSAFTLDQVATIVNTSQREGMLTDNIGALSAAFEFTSKKVDDITITPHQLVSMPQTVTAVEVERAIARTGFSRYVIVDASGEPMGYIHLKDVLDLRVDEIIPAKRIRHIVSIFGKTDLEDALATMRRSGAHLARVFDIHGATTGVLFLEDILEELVGEVQDATRRR